jgi:metal-responsive CopG/Arc/MetJ family transcriptional regulator
MKIAVTIPDRLFRKAKSHAHRAGMSQSELFSQAVAEYVIRHSADAITEAMNAVIDRVGQDDHRFILAAARRNLRTEEW